MRKTSQTTAEADVERWLDEMDPAAMKDATPLRRIMDASEAIAAANEKLRDAVSAARTASFRFGAVFHPRLGHPQRRPVTRSSDVGVLVLNGYFALGRVPERLSRSRPEQP